jgi:hypothetical protein
VLLRRAISILVLGLVVAGWQAGSAYAAWSAMSRLGVPGDANSRLAVNGRGEMVVAWATLPEIGGAQRCAVHVAFADADGRVVSRRVWSSAARWAGQPAVGLDDRGEATVAWIEPAPAQARGFGTLRAAYGSATGRWSRAATVAHKATSPRIAVGEDGAVLLAWGARKAAVAFRGPSGGFGAPQRLSRPRLSRIGIGPELVTPAFDAAGRAYLTAPNDLALATTRPHQRRFTQITVLPGDAGHDVRLGIAGAGDGLISWIASRRAQVPGAAPGPVQAAAVRNGVVGPAIVLDTATGAIALSVVSASGGGGTVTWSNVGGESFQSSVSADGIATATHQATQPVAWLVDGGGDLALTDLDELDPVPRDLTVQPIDGGPAARAPARTGRIAVAPFGRAFAMLTARVGDRYARYTIWRP